MKINMNNIIGIVNEKSENYFNYTFKDVLFKTKNFFNVSHRDLVHKGNFFIIETTIEQLKKLGVIDNKISIEIEE